MWRLKLFKKLERDDLKNPSWINKLIWAIPASARLELRVKGYSEEEIDRFYLNYLK